MSADFELSIELEVKLRLREPGLLAKLDALVSLGLLSDDRVKVLCRTYLSEPLPEPQVIASPIAQKVEEDEWIPEPLLPPVLSPVAATKTATPAKPQWIQSLMAELSVRWLLFLGVFMVVLSSGVLAATQWERFPPAGQYLVLFAYTLIFWGVSVWAQRQSQLRLTAQTLQWVSLLLLPVNFWTMDGFGLWRSPLGWVAIALAAPVLSFIAWQVLPLVLGTERPSRRTLFPLAVYPVLCYLHWGWSFPGLATIAVYLGTIATALATVSPGKKKSGVNSLSPSPANPQPFHLLLLSYALAILCGRAVFGVGVPIAQLGLAIAIGGWIILESDLTKEQPKVREPIPPVVPQAGVNILPREVTASPPQLFGYLGGWLMFAGWLVSVGEQPWQAIAISALALWWLGRRLPRFFHLFDTIAIFTITLQGYWLIRDIIPPAVRTSAIATGAQLAQAQQSPWALLGLTFFPYLLFVVWLTDWLYRRPPAQLEQGAKVSARVGDVWALGFGVILTLLSIPASSMRSLNLLASTLTLAVVTDRRLSWRTHSPTPARPIRPGEFGPFDFLVYLSHISGLLALFSFVHWGFPRLPIFVWGLILLALALAEWAVSLTLEFKPDLALNLRIAAWIESCWPVGLGLASLSYVFWVGNYDGLSTIDASQGGILWFATPLALTGIAHFSPDRRPVATGLSITTLILAQFLVFLTPATWLVGLGIATVLMVVNTRLLQHTAVAVIAIGFGLGFVFLFLDMGGFGLPSVVGEGWFVVYAIALAALCVSYAVTIQRSSSLAQLYAKAYQGWAIALGGLALTAISVHAYSLYFWGFFWGSMNSSVPILIATILIALTLTYRMWLSPAAWTFYALGWAVELIAAETLIFFGRSLISLAIANLILGLVAALVGEWWIRRTGRPLRTSWTVIPLIYGLLGQALRWGTLTSWSGLTTLTLVVIALTIGRRSREMKLLVYLALIGISVSAYEFLYYQISGLPDPVQFLAIATLGAAIVYNYRWLEPWLTDYLNLTQQEVAFFAHTHWGLSSFVWLSAIVLFSESVTAASSLGSIDLIGVGTGVFLTNYALLQGRFPEVREGEDDPRDRPEVVQTAETWVYISMVESAAVGFYLFGYLPSNLQEMFIGWGGCDRLCWCLLLRCFPLGPLGMAPETLAVDGATPPGIGDYHHGNRVFRGHQSSLVSFGTDRRCFLCVPELFPSSNSLDLLECYPTQLGDSAGAFGAIRH
ncbi:hypothetical protein [Oscillatoria acuminata]|uniref:DUF2157 domain-containing protein n=1 Tax=Oscillatoria acuminata PCC 6304 TaxID=56110 RepID=K9TFH1_9CYAN|nr:hypothetical protein [Oscillatoria acuminata]AFY80876.1 hypothetical protein Oscil6304_1150 [Oscillatoria acuminata PCC 6304]